MTVTISLLTGDASDRDAVRDLVSGLKTGDVYAASDI
jgi:hypothetical protein